MRRPGDDTPAYQTRRRTGRDGEAAINRPESPAAIIPNIENLEVRLGRTRTFGGLETKESYGPEDVAGANYARDLNDPGAYPYTRGAYPKMYRSRMWTLRNIVGYGAPEDTREGLEKALEAGSTGLNVVVDPLTTQNIDCDHPAFGPEVGLEGCSIPSARDAERLLEGIDLTKVDVAWHQAVMAYPMAAAVVVRRGQSLRDMQGSHMPDMLQQTLCGWGNDLVPAALAHGSTVDSVEFCAKNSPKWALGLPQGYDLRERGLSPAGEIAVGMAVVNQTIADLIARGMSVDDIAPRLAWVSTADIDFFEEIAKFRALRRHWARTMKERFGATDPRSMRLRIACHTSGKSLVYRQPLNNLSRVAIQSLAALLGGVQSLEACTYDEPVCVPTHEARDLATRTQQILSNEAGVARTADPLGGSYYVEALTDQVEAAAIAMLEKIEAVGLVKAVASGMIEQMMDDFNLQAQKEMDSGERVIVGLNRFIPESEPPPKRFTFDPARTKAHVARFIAMKAERDNSAVQDRLRELYATAKAGGNPMQGMIDALVADASVGEVWGAVRMAHGLTYDPYRTIECPFPLS